MTSTFWLKYRSILLYGLLLALLLFLLKWLEVRLIMVNHSFEIYAGSIALIFTVLGIWLAVKLTSPKVRTVVIEKQVFVNPSADFALNEKALQVTGLSTRELEVLQLMAQGLSNQQIADQLYVSLNTVKTHSSKVLEKLEAGRRTQAVDKARKLGIVP
ncbi:response regulator transcription factor [Mucilaginibacter roseus]|uniref:Response regulator transcription factor n=1 Tax=Mucilaginibacter roseus TaxID=1528868 RepID=A0ABS8TYT1_9SPHI|nr:LuxR C-terminal-related transcriptional regulator [Mucilaginibacter roseus]MCD8738975.1 response regulator transcription factor [Mucilaginibacter roseus]